MVTMSNVFDQANGKGWNAVSLMWTPGDSFFRIPIAAGWYTCSGHLNLGGSTPHPQLARVLTIGVNYADALGWRAAAQSSSNSDKAIALSVSHTVYLGVNYKVALFYGSNAENSAVAPIQTCNSIGPLTWGTGNVLLGDTYASLACTYLGEE